ncbi:methyltransferase type 12 [Hydrogenophaga crassostreae]|uniref:Calmodulin-lysine N-methyltransferase n=1 Tax=Hydrogenophaga crassostreae TaxID=1763535 RepID=A0A167HAU7_9BURK|nr:methyltransferase domain-containing protein [Hydrogenophaga crassostreae]AOW15408.1 methyltransferase type 12 [Hydrogenophaga crassostreae]OAD40618.1 methyltransferase type 12 [Hydrogenophaga crassostreae]
MPGYQVKHQTVTIGGWDYAICSLLDNQQYADPQGTAQNAGMGESGWPLFGQVWPSARVLALAMDTHAIAGKRILEIGAGLALASLVMHRREGDVTVTDWHPLTETFLQDNLRSNTLDNLPYHAGNWAIDDADGASGLGRFDLIVGSDVLYERQQPDQLARFIDQHALPEAEVIIVDPDRGNRSAFAKAMAALGWSMKMTTAAKTQENGDPYKGRFLNFTKPGTASVSPSTGR